MGVLMTSTVRRWATGVGLVGGAVAAAAMIAPSAYADTIDELLVQSEGDVTQAADLFAAVDTSSLSETQASGIEGIVSGLQNQGDLISQIQSLQDALPVANQTSTVVLDADQQLATASNDLLSSSNTFVNALDAGDFPLWHASSLAGDLTGLDATFGLVGSELFQVLPAEIDAEIAPIGVDPDIGTLSAAAASATTTTTANDVLSQAGQDLTQATAVLDSAPTASLGTDGAIVLTDGQSFIAQAESFLTMTESYQAGLPVADQTSPLLLDADQALLQADDGLLTADQTFVAADEAGELTGFQTSSLAGELTEIQAIYAPLHAEFGTIPATLDVGLTDIFAQLASDVGLSF